MNDKGNDFIEAEVVNDNDADKNGSKDKKGPI